MKKIEISLDSEMEEIFERLRRWAHYDLSKYLGRPFVPDDRQTIEYYFFVLDGMEKRKHLFPDSGMVVNDVKTHELKTEPRFFQAVLDGRKRFEIRRNDRGFQVGDRLILKEYDSSTDVYTGRKVEVTVTYMTDYAQQPGYVVLGIYRG